MKKNIISYLIISLTILFNCSSEDILKKNLISSSNISSRNMKNLFQELQINSEKINLISSQNREKNPTAIVIHTTDSDSMKDYLEKIDAQRDISFYTTFPEMSDIFK